MAQMSRSLACSRRPARHSLSGCSGAPSSLAVQGDELEAMYAFTSARFPIKIGSKSDLAVQGSRLGASEDLTIVATPPPCCAILSLQ